MRNTAQAVIGANYGDEGKGLMTDYHAAPAGRDARIVSHAFSGRCLPVIQCIGASKCVPVCSPIRMAFQYHAGPLSS